MTPRQPLRLWPGVVLVVIQWLINFGVPLVAPDAELEKFFNKERAVSFLDMLNERERKIIEMRYGLADGDAHTLAEIAEVLGVSRERVRQIESATLRKIRQILKQDKTKR